MVVFKLDRFGGGVSCKAERYCNCETTGKGKAKLAGAGSVNIDSKLVSRRTAFAVDC